VPAGFRVAATARYIDDLGGVTTHGITKAKNSGDEESSWRGLVPNIEEPYTKDSEMGDEFGMDKHPPWTEMNQVEGQFLGPKVYDHDLLKVRSPIS
jgi:hypothetical protein